MILQDRLTRIEYGFLQALSASSRSEDPHTKVGCAIENFDGRIIGTSYNGLKSGVGLHELGFDVDKEREKKKLYFIHAEVNALSLVKKGEVKTLYCSIAPCEACARTIPAWGVKEVRYFDLYYPSGASEPDLRFKDILWVLGVNAIAATASEKVRVKNELHKLSTQIKV